MAFRHEGNGDDKTRVDFLDRSNYVLICPHDSKTLPANIALIINTAFLDWQKKHPGVRIRTVLPITQDGQTVALHVWYDRADTETGGEGA
jgi:hypothetical protein